MDYRGIHAAIRQGDQQDRPSGLDAYAVPGQQLEQPRQTHREVPPLGREADGEPTAQDWAAAIDTINYEIVTRLGPRVPRRYLGGL